MTLGRADEALLVVGRALRSGGYRFVTPTPATHARVLARSLPARDVRDVFGWNRWFPPSLVSNEILEALRAADAVEEEAGQLRARVRFSTLGDHLVVHSGFPTASEDAVFFGPDTYRFVALVDRVLAELRPERVVEVGCGTGVAALAAKRHARSVIAADINMRALHHTAINMQLAGLDIEVTESDVLKGIEGPIDAVIANPPYLVDDHQRVYRHGGGELGLDLSVRIVEETLARTDTLVLYTGVPIMGGDDPFLRVIGPMLKGHRFRYEELDPDVFGEELERPAYREADRLAVVSLVVSPRLGRDHEGD